jgi:hypothetical protein
MLNETGFCKHSLVNILLACRISRSPSKHDNKTYLTNRPTESKAQWARLKNI